MLRNHLGESGPVTKTPVDPVVAASQRIHVSLVKRFPENPQRFKQCWDLTYPINPNTNHPTYVCHFRLQFNKRGTVTLNLKQNPPTCIWSQIDWDCHLSSPTCEQQYNFGPSTVSPNSHVFSVIKIICSSWARFKRVGQEQLDSSMKTTAAAVPAPKLLFIYLLFVCLWLVLRLHCSGLNIFQVKKTRERQRGRKQITTPRVTTVL